MILVYKKISLFFIFLVIFSVTGFGQCTTTTCITVNSSSDDAEEFEDGYAYIVSRDLEMVFDDDYPDTGYRGNQEVGIRFNSVDVPQGATITNAYIQFAADPIVTPTEIGHGGNNVDPCNLTIFGEDVDNATTFIEQLINITERSKTTANVAWNPPFWPTPGAQTSDQQTTDISVIIQEIVNRPGYSINNSIAIIITGTGRRTAAAYDGTPSLAPQLCIEYECVADYVYDNGWQGGMDPNGNATIVEDILIKSGDATISINTTSNSLVVNPEANLTIDSGISLTTNSIILESKSDKYSSLLSIGTINGTVHYDRYVNEISTTNSNNNGNDLVSSPLMGEIFNDAFVTKNSSLAENPGNSGEFAFAPFNTSSGAYENYDIDSTNDSTNEGSINLESGKGYRAATIDGSPLRFSGTVNTGTVSTPIANGEWNLIGNPYPSYLKVNDGSDGFLNNATNISLLDETNVGIYGYNGTNAGGIWTIYNLANTNSSTVIAPGQGFYVNTSGVGSNIEFTSNMRTIGSDDDFIVGRTFNTTKVLSKLQASIGTEIYETDIYFIDGRTRGLDFGYDAGAFQGNAEGIFTNLVEENSGVEMAIQSLPYEDFNDVVVPLGIKANSGTQLTISIDEASTLPLAVNVYLEDNVANTFTLLNSKDFIFRPLEDINGTGRFFVHYSSTTLSLNNKDKSGLQIFTTANPKLLYVNGKLSDTAILDLFDIQGRLVLTKKLDLYGNSNVIDIESMSTGVYMVKLNIGNLTRTQKVIVR